MMEPLNENERHAAYHAVDQATMVLLEPEVMTAVVAAVDAIEHAAGLMVDRGQARASSVGSILGAVVQRLVTEG
jgi:hypothetical protein